MSFVIEHDGINLLVFMHQLSAYVLIPQDFALREKVVKAEKEILQGIKIEIGNEVQSLIFMHTYLC